MNPSLNDALALINLQPGETCRVTVNGREMEVRALAATEVAEPVEEPVQHADREMLNLWLDIPPSAAARTVTVQRGEPLLPAPFHLDESDLAPE